MCNLVWLIQGVATGGQLIAEILWANMADSNHNIWSDISNTSSYHYIVIPQLEVLTEVSINNGYDSLGYEHDIGILKLQSSKKSCCTSYSIITLASWLSPEQENNSPACGLCST